MIRKETWDKIKNRWPTYLSTGWDHWLRHGSGLESRECIAPEVSRTHHVEESAGTNVKKGSKLAKLLTGMPLSRLPPGNLGDLSYLRSDAYEAQLQKLVKAARLVTFTNLKESKDLNASSSSVFLVPYVRESYANLAKFFRVSGQPRTSHRGLLITRDPRHGAVVILVDERLGKGYLPEELLWRPKATIVGKATPGESCDDYCKHLDLRCEANELEYINNCEAMMREFPCENGCGHQVGKEIPAYVHARGRDTSLQCLVTDDVISTCAAKQQFTTRFCACVGVVKSTYSVQGVSAPKK